MLNRSQNESVVAAIVVYNPDADRLEQNVAAVSPQVGRVYLMDNNSNNRVAAEGIAVRYDNVVLVENHSNVGISKALNKAALFCDELGCDYLLALDQDSVCPDGMVERLLRCFDEDDIGLACPSYYDSRRGSYNPRHSFDKPVSLVDVAITSGSLCSMRAFHDVGGFDENLFVGGTDEDYCLSLKKSGWRIAQVNELLLDHELGVVEASNHEEMWRKLHELTGVSLFGKLTYKRKVSTFRAYHGARTQAYMRRKHGCQPSVPTIIKNIASNTIRADKRCAVLFSSCKGLIDGMRIPMKRSSEDSK